MCGLFACVATIFTVAFWVNAWHTRNTLYEINEVLNNLWTRLHGVPKILKEVQMTLDDIVAKVTAERSVIDSAVTLLEELKTELDAAVASGDPAKIQAVIDLIDQGQQKLAAAVVANTPPPVTPPTP